MCGIRGRGSFGTVYRAMEEARTQAGPVALKLANFPGDARFEREVELLSRIRHPSVPRLLDSGMWRSPWEGSHPYVVMEWVEGEPLYRWAARRNPSSRQVLALLAQAAGALQAIHEVSGVHRDVKGDNMLVRPADGRLFLTDLGAGIFAGATRQTPWNMGTGTPEYRSLELWQSLRQRPPDATASRVARPAEDVFALGVTAYRLVTDSYPRFLHLEPGQGWSWLPGEEGVVPARQLNPRVDAQLNALILRMLSPRPEERGLAGELAQAMERGVAHAGPSADTPLFEWEALEPSRWTREELAEAEHLGYRPGRRDRRWALQAAQADAAARAPPRVKSRRWPAWLAAALAVGLWPSEPGSLRTGPRALAVYRASEGEGDVVSLGDSVRSSSAVPGKDSAQAGVAEELPEQPFLDQIKPDARGRCPKQKQIALRGGCWLKVDFDLEDCPGNGFTYQGACYVPVRTSGRRPTSAPPKR
ncbi:MAG TPA: serine/threonine-protein kinase [Myxococcaceae bacterium]